MHRLKVARLHVLLVDDDVEQSEPQAEELESLGCQVEVVADGVDAVRRTLSTQPDVVLMDIVMPGMSGYEAIRLIRARVRGGYQPHIIVISGYGNARTRQLAFEAGCDEFMAKPDCDVPGALRALVVRWAAGMIRV